MKMSKAAKLALCAALLSGGTAWTSVHAADRVELNPRFVQLDKDRDGFLTLQETAGRPGYHKAFAEADDDRDGRLSPNEFPKAESNYDRMRAATYTKDRLITAKVKTALIKSPSVKALDVNVDTYDGRVLLSGFVRSPEQRDRAIEVASRIEGVTAVENGMVVK